MHTGPLRVLHVSGDAARRGRAHGARYADGISSYLSDRLALASERAWSGRSVPPGQVLDLAVETLPFHHRYAPDLHEEMVSLATSAGISPEEAVVVGGFTDLIDVVRARAESPVIDECTLVLDPESGAYAQTWDMHASAGEFVILLHVEPDSGPAAYVHTTMGCLGQIGMNEAGIGVGINNLTSIGRPGVTWPFVVRKVLQQSDLDDAVKCVLDAPLAGGHNFAIVGPDGHGVNIEAMPDRQHVTRIENEPFVHSNHCLEAETRLEEGFREQVYVEDSDIRLEVGRQLAHDFEEFFANPRISKRALDPVSTATCGAVIMNPREREMKAVWGVPGDQPWESFRF